MMIPLHILGRAVLTDWVAGATTTTELQATDLEFVIVSGAEVTIAYVLYTNDGLCVMQERVTSIAVAPTGGGLTYAPMAYLDWQSVSESPGPFSLVVERDPVSITVGPNTGKWSKRDRCHTTKSSLVKVGGNALLVVRYDLA